MILLRPFAINLRHLKTVNFNKLMPMDNQTPVFFRRYSLAIIVGIEFRVFLIFIQKLWYKWRTVWKRKPETVKTFRFLFTRWYTCRANCSQLSKKLEIRHYCRHCKWLALGLTIGSWRSLYASITSRKHYRTKGEKIVDTTTRVGIYRATNCTDTYQVLTCRTRYINIRQRLQIYIRQYKLVIHSLSSN